MTQTSAARLLKVGVHPSNTSLFVLRRRGILEALVADLEAHVLWVEYDDGRYTVDLLASGEIDIGGTGSTPPVRAQSEGVDIVYVAVSEPRPAHGVLVVREDSPIREVADLRGKRVALAEGSYQTALLATALDQAGLAYDDVEKVSGGHGEGKRAFLAGEVDAWVGGDPELADAQRVGGVRELVDTAAVISNRSVWFARRDFATRTPKLLDAVVTALRRADGWIAEHPREAAELFARDVAGSPDVDAWETALRRRPWGPHAVSDEFVAEQQRAADLFARQGIIPRAISVADAVLAPTPALAAVVS
jgi:sulfonate transport system substrate-binding protein